MELYIYLLAGSIIILLYFDRTRRLKSFTPESIPELDKAAFFQLKELLDTAYERMLYLAFAFYLLGFMTYMGQPVSNRFFALLFLLGIFIYNIPPRNRIFRFLESYNLSIDTLKSKGIKL